jgi:hypothetical protein
LIGSGMRAAIPLPSCDPPLKSVSVFAQHEKEINAERTAKFSGHPV